MSLPIDQYSLKIVSTVDERTTSDKLTTGNDYYTNLSKKRFLAIEVWLEGPFSLDTGHFEGA
jgi:hypothetical protein